MSDMGINIFYNDKDPDNILREVTSFVNKFKSIVERCESEADEWLKRDESAYAEYLEKKAECDDAKAKLDDARAMARKMLSVFD